MVIPKIIRRRFKRILNNKEGGVATYVLIMFGMSIILYMFGFTSVWNSYTAVSDNETLTDTSESFGTGILEQLSKALSDPDNWGWVGGGILAFLTIAIVGKLTGSIGTILQFLLPLFLLIALNVFVFPLNGLQGDLAFMTVGGVSLSLFLFVFFNLFFILAVVEFMRGSI